jgi:beta-lactamase regulating signal transducer with metallopeptidase domain
MNTDAQWDNFWYGIGTAWPDAGAEGLWRACWQGGLLLLGIWVFCRLFPRLSVGARHWLWWLACLKLIFALVWSAPVQLVVLPAPLPPNTAITDRPRVSSAANSSANPTAPDVVSSRVKRSGVASESENVSAAKRQESPASVPGVRPSFSLSAVVSDAVWRPLPLLTLCWAGWLAGIGVRLIAATRQVMRLRRAISSACDREPTQLEADVVALSMHMGLRRPPRVRLCEAIEAPLIFGLFRPCIVLPAAFQTLFSPTEQHMVIAHELAHLRRRDLWLALVPMLARTLFFFLPFVGRACREWTLAREALCDAEALSVTGSSPTAYKVMLLKAALGVKQGRTFVSLGITSGYQTLSRRLTLLERLRNGAAYRGGRSVSLALAVFSVLFLIPWQLAAPRPLPPTYRDVRQTVEAKIRAKIMQAHPTARYRITNLSLMYPGLRSVIGINTAGEIIGYGSMSSPTRSSLSLSSGKNYVWLLDGKGGWQNLGEARTREGLPDLGAWDREFLPQPCQNTAGEWIGWHKILHSSRSYDLDGHPYTLREWTANVGRYRNGRHIGWESLLPKASKIFPRTWNRKGEVLGEAQVRERNGLAFYPVLYDGKTLHMLSTLKDQPYPGGVYGLNTQGEVVGSTCQNSLRVNSRGAFISPNGREERALLFREEKATDLNLLIPRDSGWVLKLAVAINDAGHIVGYGRSDAMPLLRGIRLPRMSSTSGDENADTLDIFLLTPAH